MTGYVRKDTTNNIADGNVINAADLDAEFDGVQDAFNASTGHNHDGTSGEGAPITALGPTQDVTISAILLAPKTTNTVDIGSSSLRYKDLFLAGNGSIGGTLAVTGVATLTAQPILSSLTASRAVFTDGSKGLVSNAITGTGNVVMSASPTLTGTIDAAAATLSGNLTLSAGTANGVAYLNGSKVVTSGSALTFDGANVLTLFRTTGTEANEPTIKFSNLVFAGQNPGVVKSSNGGLALDIQSPSDSTFQLRSRIYMNGGSGDSISFQASSNNGSTYGERMVLTSTGLGIGTSSPTTKLSITDSTGPIVRLVRTSNRFELSADTDFMSLNARDASTYITFKTADTERMRLDTSGNLGLGVTPSAWTTLTAFQNKNSSWYGSGNEGGIYANAYYASGSWRYIATAAATGYDFNATAGQHRWFNAPSGTAGNAITFTQAMTLDASGNFILGATSASGRARIVAAASTDCGLVLDTSTNNYASFISLNALNDNGAIYNYIRSQVSGGTEHWKIGGGATASTMAFSTGGTERARIDSSGNFSVGNTAAAYIQLQPAGNVRGVHASGAGGDTILGAINGVSNGYQISVTTGNAQTYKWNNGGTQSMTLDASGRLGIGTTSPDSKLVVEGSSGTYVQVKDGTVNTFIQARSADSSGVVGTLTNHALAFYTNSTEKARIDSSGNLLVGTTTNLSSAAKLSVYNTGGGSGGAAIGYGSSNGQFRVMYLLSSNGVFYFDSGTNAASLSAAGAWTNASDARLKNSITDIKYGLSTVLNTQPRSYKMNDLEGDYIGFVAQEIQAVIPEVVSGDPEKQLGVDYGSLVAVAFKAIQEQQAIIESLKARLDAANL